MTDLATAEPTLPPLAAVADVEDFTGPLADDDLARVGRWLTMASAAVRRYTRQTISLVADDAVVIPSSGTTLLVLAQRPVRHVSSVVVQYGWAEWPSEPGLPAALAGWADPALGRFTWDAYGRLTRLDGLTWGTRFDPVAVTYTHGWDPVPPDVVGLVAAKVATFITGQGANPEGLKSLQVGAMSQTFSNSLGSEAALGPGGLTKAEEDALADYRLRAFAVDIGAQ